MRCSIGILAIAGVIALLGCQESSTAVQDDPETIFPADMAEIMDHMKDYTLAVYDIPHDSLMDFRPSEEVMSFEEQAAHILSNMYVQHTSFLITDTTTNLNAAIEKSAEIMAITDRQELRTRLSEQFDEISAYLRTMDTSGDWNKERVLPQFDGKPKKDLMTILMMMRDHITHHRAQMIVYLRLMGYQPPRYAPF